MTKTVLVVDDDKLIRASYHLLLKRKGYTVLLADDGDAAISMLHAAPVDVVVLDVLMPKKEGIETLMEIKRAFPSVKVIVMTGGGARDKYDFLTVAKKFGADGVIRKPMTPATLLAAIADACDGPTRAVQE